ncbi:xylose operon regulatory protein, partial [mine drainage metagenome]
MWMLLLCIIGILQRDSTRHRAIDDPDVVSAMKIIQDNCGRRIRVDDLIDSMATSRRSLEMKFNLTLGHGIWAEVQRTRVELAKKLIRETDMKLSAIARRAGFASGAHLTEAFQRIAGGLPSAYRRRR